MPALYKILLEISGDDAISPLFFRTSPFYRWNQSHATGFDPSERAQNFENPEPEAKFRRPPVRFLVITLIAIVLIVMGVIAGLIPARGCEIICLLINFIFTYYFITFLKIFLDMEYQYIYIH
jgi:hypothetical protein